MTDAVLILDCGATSVRAVAVDARGKTLAKASRPNATINPPENPDWHVWPLDTILGLLGECSRQILAEMQGQVRITGLSVTTFGVDGALVIRAPGEWPKPAGAAPARVPGIVPEGSDTLQLYDVISWKCPRTLSIMDRVDALLGGTKTLQAVGGVGRFYFNTIYKLAWLKQEYRKSNLLKTAEAWLFMPSLIAARLGADWYTDRTMAGTSGLVDPASGKFNPAILGPLGLDKALFPPLKDAGEPVGSLSAGGAALLGLDAGVPIFASGHDTQCALIGSGAGKDQPVLSSGTWEILMARTPQADQQALASAPASTCELDAVTGLLNPGLQWLGSGVLEWVKASFFADGTDYAAMIAQAAQVTPGSGGVTFDAGFFLAGHPGGGSIHGLTHQTSRAAVYRAALEGLAFLLARQLETLEGLCGFRAESLLMVGGGTKNRLWNQIKADVLRRPVQVVEEPETTVLGAACCVLKGLGLAASLEAARQGFSLENETFLPGPDSVVYQELRKKFIMEELSKETFDNSSRRGVSRQ